MSWPTIEDIARETGITCDGAIALLLKSIAMQDQSIARLLDAERNKLMYAVGALGHNKGSTGDVLAVNDSVNAVVVSLSKLQMLLHYKIESIAQLTRNAPIKRGCRFNGEMAGVIQNRADAYNQKRAVLTATALCSGRSRHNAVRYSVGDDGASMQLVAAARGIRVECPCQWHPDGIRVWGRGRLMYRREGKSRYTNALFRLHGWCDGAGVHAFNITILTCGRRSVIHDSGMVSVENDAPPCRDAGDEHSQQTEKA